MIVVYLQIDTVVIALLVDEETLGWYSTADVLSSSALFVPTIVMSTLFPVIGRLHSADPREAADMARRALSLLMLAGVALGFGTVVVAEPVSVLLFGEEFRQTGAVLAVLGAMMPFIFGTMMLGTIAMATDRRRFWNLMMIAAILATVLLDLVLVPWFDEVVRQRCDRRRSQLPRRREPDVHIGPPQDRTGALTADDVNRVPKIITAGGVMVLAAWAVRDVFVLVPISVGAAVFVAMITAFGVLDAEERRLLVKLRSKLLEKVGITSRRGDARCRADAHRGFGAVRLGASR